MAIELWDFITKASVGTLILETLKGVSKWSASQWEKHQDEKRQERKEKADLKKQEAEVRRILLATLRADEDDLTVFRERIIIAAGAKNASIVGYNLDKIQSWLETKNQYLRIDNLRLFIRKYVGPEFDKQLAARGFFETDIAKQFLRDVEALTVLPDRDAHP